MNNLKFTKPLMSITELVGLGYSRTDLKAYSQVKDFPCVRTQGGGKILIKTDEVDTWIDEYQSKLIKAREINSRKILRFR